jgi:hypothetical protein
MRWNIVTDSTASAGKSVMDNILNSIGVSNISQKEKGS